MAIKCQQFLRNIDETAVVRIYDPIYGVIQLESPLSDIFLSEEMQRLDDYCQTGFSKYEYEGLANGKRLEHCVGVYERVNKMIIKFEEEFGSQLPKEEREEVLIAALIHDIGHGPLSHSLEAVTKYDHEQRINDIITGEYGISNILKKHFTPFRINRILKLISGEVDNSYDYQFQKIYKFMLSGAFDGDKCDYLKRDHSYAGIDIDLDTDQMIDSMVIYKINGQCEIGFYPKDVERLRNFLDIRKSAFKGVYTSVSNEIREKKFELTIARLQNNKELSNLDIPYVLKLLQEDSRISDTSAFLKLKEEDFDQALLYLSKLTKNNDEIMSRLSNMFYIDDYKEMHCSKNELERGLLLLFPNLDISQTLAIMETNTKIKPNCESVISVIEPDVFDDDEETIIVFKKGQAIECGRSCLHDLKEYLPDYIKGNILDRKYLLFNKQLLKIELGLSDEEFSIYEPKLDEMIKLLNGNEGSEMTSSKVKSFC